MKKSENEKTKKSWVDAHEDELFTDNTKNCEQCRGCRHKDETKVNGREKGWEKGFCKIYGSKMLENGLRDALGISYTPVFEEGKPSYVIRNRDDCDYFEEEEFEDDDD